MFVLTIRSAFDQFVQITAAITEVGGAPLPGIQKPAPIFLFENGRLSEPGPASHNSSLFFAPEQNQYTQGSFG